VFILVLSLVGGLSLFDIHLAVKSYPSQNVYLCQTILRPHRKCHGVLF